jgi:hypothetical protein
MANNTKRIGLLFLVGTLISLILLAGSLSNLQLRAGAPFPSGGNSTNETQFSPNLTPVKTYSFPILKGLFSLFFLILAIDVSVRLIALINIKKTLKLLAALAILFLIIINIPPAAPGRPARVAEEFSNPTDSSSSEYATAPLGKPPQELIWLVMIGLALGAGFVIIAAWRRRPLPAGIEDQISQEAESAVHALEVGGDLRNVIIRCYLQMTHALQEERGIERSYNITVQEFEETLESKGFPTVPVYQLTRLFEKVRYGEQQIMKNDEEAAVESLNEIIRFCRNGRN